MVTPPDELRIPQMQRSNYRRAPLDRQFDSDFLLRFLDNPLAISQLAFRATAVLSRLRHRIAKTESQPSRVDAHSQLPVLHGVADTNHRRSHTRGGADAVLFFATGPHFITGQILGVDGGLGL